jgi:hypothetical protein
VVVDTVDHDHPIVQLGKHRLSVHQRRHESRENHVDVFSLHNKLGLAFANCLALSLLQDVVDWGMI